MDTKNKISTINILKNNNVIGTIFFTAQLIKDNKPAIFCIFKSIKMHPIDAYIGLRYFIKKIHSNYKDYIILFADDNSIIRDICKDRLNLPIIDESLTSTFEAFLRLKNFITQNNDSQMSSYAIDHDLFLMKNQELDQLIKDEKITIYNLFISSYQPEEAMVNPFGLEFLDTNINLSDVDFLPKPLLYLESITFALHADKIEPQQATPRTKLSAKQIEEINQMINWPNSIS